MLKGFYDFFGLNYYISSYVVYVFSFKNVKFSYNIDFIINVIGKFIIENSFYFRVCIGLLWINIIIVCIYS